MEDVVANAVSDHLIGGTRKALVFSFHGWPGSGKNYVATFLATSMFKMGEKSSFYKYYNARIDFPLESKSQEYQVCTN